MTSYLVVKTGLSGTKVNDLWQLDIGGERIVPLHRLTGNWRTIIIDACKQKGATGTMSVLGYQSKEQVDELVKDYNKSLLALTKNINWQPVARIDADIETINKKSVEARQKVWEELAESGRIVITQRDRRSGRVKRYNLMNLDHHRYQTDKDYRDWYKREMADIKRRVNAGGVDVFKPHITMIDSNEETA